MKCTLSNGCNYTNTMLCLVLWFAVGHVRHLTQRLPLYVRAFIKRYTNYENTTEILNFLAMDTDTIIEAYGLQTRTWTFNETKKQYGCSECCNGDRCDEDCTAKYKGDRKNCPHCKGKGWIPLEDVTSVGEKV